MDYLSISDNETSSVILSKTVVKRWLKIDAQKVPKYKLKKKAMV